MAMQSGVNALSTFPFQAQNTNTLINPRPSLTLSRKPVSRYQSYFTTWAAPEALTTVEESTATATATADDSVIEKVEVKIVKKPRLVLKFIWMEKNIGLALDQVVPGHGTVPLSPYFFWPRKDAWEELKTTLESKPWISQKKMIILLNQATDIINLWQQSGGNIS
ncbi:hypothetical protein ACFE04_018749 [Oxalis oulophora]